MKSHRDQLREIRGALLVSNAKDIPTHPSAWVKDGEDHINVSKNGATDLGRWLSSNYAFDFNHPVLASFRSLDNLSAFIRMSTFDDRVRSQGNFGKVKEMVQAAGGYLKNTVNYRAIMIHSLYLRVLANERLMHQLITSTLPFDSYTQQEGTGLRQRFEPLLFMVSGLRDIRDAVKERRELTKRSLHIDSGEVYEDLLIRLTGGYNHEVVAGLIDKYVAQRWEAYDNWVEAQARRAEKERVAEERKASKAEAKIEEVGGVSDSVIRSSEAPKPGSNTKIGTRWHNSETNETMIYIQLTDEKIWVTVTELLTKGFINAVSKTLVTGMDFLNGPVPDIAELTNGELSISRIWEECWKIYNPLTRSFSYPVMEAIDSPVTFTKVQPERFKKAKEDRRKVATEAEIAELASIPAAAIAAVDESVAVQVKVDDTCNILDTSHVEAVAAIEDQPALDESFSITAAGSADGQTSTSSAVEILQAHDAMVHRLEEQPEIVSQSPEPVSAETLAEIENDLQKVEEIVADEAPVVVADVNAELAQFQNAG